VRRRILGAIVAVTAVAVALFALPLALAVQHLYHSEAVVRLEREATRATASVPDTFKTSGDPVELSAPSDATQLALYSTDGRLVTGSGPTTIEPSVRAAFGGRVAEHTDEARIVVAVPVADEERVVAVVRAALPAAVVDARVRRAWLAMAALAAGAVTVAALVARTLAGRLSRPVDALALTAARLGDGDFSVRAGRSGVAEVDAVAATLDATAERLGQLLARERAFSADASHQLRTALAGLRLRLEAARLLPGADQGQAIADALVEVDRLEATVEQLLALARDAGVARDRLDLPQVLHTVEQGWHGRLGAAGRPLRFRLDGELPTVRASEAAVMQVLDVLVGNATDHGSGAVTVRVRTAPGGLAIEVGDEGPGMAGDPERVFVRRSMSAVGHGIGLALARSLAEAEGGRLLLQRPEPNPVFALLLPADQPAAPADAAMSRVVQKPTGPSTSKRPSA
jgi:signal transduction histidine kinase